uniref:Uncharacterized protein n=1 Tax=Anguilla anguilla TaxID=7936 RepID=A0A0E9Q7E2_ANGAN
MVLLNKKGFIAYI